MNWANRLTVSRFFLTIGFVAVLNTDWRGKYTAALALFVLAAITDYLDGWMARNFAMQTPFGALMDPLMDKIMTAAAFICLIPIGAIPAWAAIVVISREFLITGLRLLASSQGKLLSAEAVGKHKTGWQIATIIFFLTGCSLVEWLPSLLQSRRIVHLWHGGEIFCLTAAVTLTVYSGASYLWKHRALLQTT